MHLYERALMNLTIDDDGQVVREADGQPFDRVGYSRFKYGWTRPAVDYAAGLANLIADELFALAGARPILIVSAPYKFLPTASHAIAQYLRDNLTVRASEVGLEPPRLVPFHKAHVGDSSYARSNQADRLKTVAALGLHIDESLVPDSHILVVDDIRITGSAQDATAAYLEPLGPKAAWYLHAACLQRSIARRNPQLEDELNQSVVHTLTGFLSMEGAGEFQLNTRVLRFILESSKGEFSRFLTAAPWQLLNHIHLSALGTGRSYCDQFPETLGLLEDELRSRGVGEYLRSTSSARR